VNKHKHAVVEGENIVVKTCGLRYKYRSLRFYGWFSGSERKGESDEIAMRQIKGTMIDSRAALR
jgi:hypothetical protein